MSDKTIEKLLGWFIFAVFVAIVSVSIASLATAQTLDPKVDVRVGQSVIRTPAGVIKRSTAVIAAFQKLHPCPSTGAHIGACPGWAVDHVIPLACGGVDAVYNMQWLPDQVKSCAVWCKDRWERKIYASDPPALDSPACVNSIVVLGP